MNQPSAAGAFDTAGGGQGRRRPSLASQQGPQSSRRVRFNGLRFVSSAWHNISRASKALLILSVSLVFVQIATTIVVLIVARNEICDKPLELYLIVYIARVAVACPFLVYQHLQTSQRPRRNNNNNQRHSAGAPSSSSSNSNTSNNGPTTTAALPPQQPPRPPPPSPVAIEWVDRLKSLLDLFAVLWFIVGNYFLFTSETCAQDAPALFFTTLVWVLLGYLLILIPLFLCASVIFCLPCVLVALRALNVGHVPGMTGATKEEIRSVPVYRFKHATTDITSSSGSLHPESASPSDHQQHYPSPKKSSSFFKRFMRLHRSKEEDRERDYPDIVIAPAEDAMCPICLSEYDDGDLICKLWCEHHFHRGCVQEWLILNSKCPLCKRDFRGKQYAGEDEEGDSA